MAWSRRRRSAEQVYKTKLRMNNAAELAENDLQDLLAGGGLDEATVRRIAGWWSDNQEKTGNVRLVNILLKYKEA